MVASLNETSYSYDTANSNPDLQHDMVTVTYPNGQSGGPDAGDKLTNTYNAQGEVTQQVDPAGITTAFNYGSMNIGTGTGITIVTNEATNSETAYSYTDGLITWEATAFGSYTQATTSYQYNPLVLLPSAVTDGNGYVASSSYDANGDLLTYDDYRGYTTTYTYNSLGEPLTVAPPLGAETVNQYDADGNLKTSTVEGENVTGNPAPNLETQYTYGDSSNPGLPTQVTDPAGNVTNYTYDGSGDVTSKTVYSTSTTSATTTYAYDPTGALYCEVPPVENAAGVSCPSFGAPYVSGTTSYTRNGDDAVTAVEDPDGNSTSTTYDGDGNVTLEKDANGDETSSTYDADDRLIKTVVGYGSSTAATTSYSYDIAPGTGSCSSSVTNAVYCDTTVDPNSHTTVDYWLYAIRRG